MFYRCAFQILDTSFTIRECCIEQAISTSVDGNSHGVFVRTGTVPMVMNESSMFMNEPSSSETGYAIQVPFGVLDIVDDIAIRRTISLRAYIHC